MDVKLTTSMQFCCGAKRSLKCFITRTSTENKNTSVVYYNFPMYLNYKMLVQDLRKCYFLSRPDTFYLHVFNVYFFLPAVCFFTWKFNNSMLESFLTHNFFIKCFVQFIVKVIETFFIKGNFSHSCLLSILEKRKKCQRQKLLMFSPTTTFK